MAIPAYVPNGAWTKMILARTHATIPNRSLSTTIVDQAHGFPYSKRLEGHKSCINALNFSSGEGRFLASGGDDRWMCLWDFHQEDITVPSYSLRLGGPKGNIFCMEFSVTNKYLICGGASHVVLKYDIASLGSTVEPFTNYSPNQLYDDHNDTIRAITCHPAHDEFFMTASEDGTIRRYDIRQPRRSQIDRGIIQLEREITGLQYHPLMDNLFISSDNAGDVFLWDARIAYTGNNSTTKGVVERYQTKLTQLSEPCLCSPEPSSVVFDREGTKFAVTFLNYLPTIYALNDPNPLAVLSAQTRPDGSAIPPGQRTYSNSCTMKHGAFGGPGMDTRDTLYAGGSDDFSGYVWKIPHLQELREQRENYSPEGWVSSDCQKIAFSSGKRGTVVPVEISTPFCRLTGHESIVNTIAFHPHFLHIATAGIEKRIVLHSPTPSSPCTQDLSLSPTQVRQLTDGDREDDAATYNFALANSLSMDEIEEQATLGIFDQILRECGDVDVFGARRLRTSSSSSDSEEEADDSPMNDSSDDEDLPTTALIL